MPLFYLHLLILKSNVKEIIQVVLLCQEVLSTYSYTLTPTNPVGTAVTSNY
jgi:hypothetical protein